MAVAQDVESVPSGAGVLHVTPSLEYSYLQLTETESVLWALALYTFSMAIVVSQEFNVLNAQMLDRFALFTLARRRQRYLRVLHIIVRADIDEHRLVLLPE